mgnify:CR=1 FL=1
MQHFVGRFIIKYGINSLQDANCSICLCIHFVARLYCFGDTDCVFSNGEQIRTLSCCALRSYNTSS